MQTLRSHVGGSYIEPVGKASTLVNPATEEPLAEVATGAVDWARCCLPGLSGGGLASARLLRCLIQLVDD